MYVLSVEDIDLMIALVNNDKLPSEFIRHQKQMDKLISMGIIRPGGGVLALTELGFKTANGLMGRCLGSNVDGPLRPTAATAAQTMASDESDTHIEDNTEAAEPAETSEAIAEATADAVSEDAGAEPGVDTEAAAEPA